MAFVHNGLSVVEAIPESLPSCGCHQSRAMAIINSSPEKIDLIVIL
ncbi:hypothetical protein H8F26_17210 [Synechococcus sp. CBW1006]|nr:hypothetical protein H8F26_17210 [Synechococcus sp. CBW1006]